MSLKIRRPAAAATAAVLLLAACTTRDQRIGSDDGTDACRPQLVQLDSTGNFFGEDIVRGAAMGAVGGAALGALVAVATGQSGRGVGTGAAIGAVTGGVAGGVGGYLSARQQQARDQAELNASIAGDLARENAELDRTQRAFDLLMDCRFATAQRAREDYRAGRLNRDQAQAILSAERARAQRDLQLARTINERITRRGAEFDTALDAVAPGAKQQIAGARVSRPVPIQVRAAVPLKLRPDPASPEVARVEPRERVTVRPASGGYALVETSSGIRGYAPANAFPGTRTATAARAASSSAPAAGQEGGDVRTLAATNIERRDNFAESLGNAERLAQGQGFELAS